MEEYVILVDKDDNAKGQVEKMFAHKQVMLHRAFSVFIYRINESQEVEILLQKRSNEKYHSKGLWTNSCCGHPRPGEKNIDAAKRRLFEEVGINNNLTYVDKFWYTAPLEDGLSENEIDHVFIGKWENEPLNPTPAEISECIWRTIDEIKKAFKANPKNFTTWFGKALNVALKKGDFS